MSEFNPDAFLASTQAEGFNPDAFLASTGMPKAIEAPSKWEALTRGFKQGGTLGFGDELVGAATSLLAPSSGAQLTPQAMAEMQQRGIEVQKEPSRQDIYRQAREGDRAANASAQKAHGGYYLGGELGGGVASSFMPGVGLLNAGKGAGLASAIGKGAALGGIAGLGGSNADLTQGQYGSAAFDTGLGATVGAGLGAAIPLGAKLLHGITHGVVEPSAGSQFLRSKGVDLTLGQMNPGGALAQLEEAGTSLPGVGKMLEAQRQAGRESWQNAVLGEAMAPGTEMGAAPGISDKLSQASESFDPAYEQVKGLLIPRGRLSGEQFSRIANDKNILATDSARQSVASFLENQASILEGRVHPDLDRIPSEALLQMRSNIRAKASQYSSSPNPEHKAIGEMFSNAEDYVTNKLEEGLKDYQIGINKPLAASDVLRKIDKQYSQYKTVSNAVAAANDSPMGFTPAQLSTSIKSGMNKGAYARGDGGPLRDLAKYGREALDTRSPVTGARLLTVAPAGYVSAPLTALGNTPAVKSALLGEAGWQRAAQGLGERTASMVGSAQMAKARALAEALRRGALTSGLVTEAQH